MERERRRRARERHNETWGRLGRHLAEAERGEFAQILRGGWEAVKGDPMRVIPAAWTAESMRRLTMPAFRKKCPEVAQWKHSGGTPRLGRDLLRGLDRHVVWQGFRFGIYDWGDPPERGPSPADLEAQAAEGDMRARAAIDWADYQLNPSE